MKEDIDKILKDSNSENKKKALEEIIRKELPDKIMVISRFMCDDDTWVRQTAFNFLFPIRTDEVLDYWLAAIGKVGSDNYYISRALRNYNPDEYCDRLLNLIKSNDIKTKKQALDIISDLGEAVDAMDYLGDYYQKFKDEIQEISNDKSFDIASSRAKHAFGIDEFPKIKDIKNSLALKILENQTKESINLGMDHLIDGLVYEDDHEIIEAIFDIGPKINYMPYKNFSLLLKKRYKRIDTKKYVELAKDLGEYRNLKSYNMLYAMEDKFKSTHNKDIKSAIIESISMYKKPEFLNYLKQKISDKDCHESIVKCLAKESTNETVSLLGNFIEKASSQTLYYISQIIEKALIPSCASIIYAIVEQFKEEDGWVDLWDTHNSYLKPKIAYSLLKSAEKIGMVADERIAKFMKTNNREIREITARILSFKGTLSAIPYLKEHITFQLELERGTDAIFDTKSYEVIHNIHQRLKPQGYNPPIKRLAS